MAETKHDYKPSYVWPNPAFPFRVYYDGPECRIFIIENIRNNWNWMYEWHEHFRPTDIFFVYSGWYQSVGGAKDTEKIFRLLGLRKENFFFMFNSPLEQQNFDGFQGAVINHNAWLDENLVMKPLGLPKEYDAIYVARRSAFKRHELAAKVGNLALVAGINHGNAEAPLPPHRYLNDTQLTPDQVCEMINKASCGLIMSETEGACFASSEYLLCGVPVVSTPSYGGRDVWYNEYNSIIADPTPEAIAEAVEEMVRWPRNPARIRQMHLDQANAYRQAFIKALDGFFKRFGVTSVDADKYFKDTFFHKLRKSYVPDFKKIFG
ncbi:glycosyltransferase [Maritimibacter alkaliphilus]|uniref:glycosyltransferase n=1 Tax=Maritimibacter alkaliphilus TaxID=404236 RepID=UPI001C9527CD|nr:glycosyltransferase [Maritimibacter alkaliphilus]MBY6092903.1 glycosyltransferase [Maritimibacter alkaliphilus]